MRPPRLTDKTIRSWFLVGLVVLLWPQVFGAQQNGNTKRVLILYWDTKDSLPNISFDQGFQAGMRSYTASNVEYYTEYFDSARFPGERQSELLRDYLRQKYAG